MRRYSKKVILRYFLFQLPPLLLFSVILYWLQISLNFSLYVIYVMICAWVIKDIIMFFFVWRAYEWPSGIKALTLRDDFGQAVEDMQPDGYIRVGGELWHAKLANAEVQVRAGDRVKIIRQAGLTLIVEPEFDQPG